MSTIEEDLKIARALGMYARITSHNGQAYPDVLGERYRGDVEGRCAFLEGWEMADIYIAKKALDLVWRKLESTKQT